ncbi:unnamed protein product [Caenorhabditis brenneri]
MCFFILFFITCTDFEFNFFQTSPRLVRSAQLEERQHTRRQLCSPATWRTPSSPFSNADSAERHNRGLLRKCTETVGSATQSYHRHGTVSAQRVRSQSTTRSADLHRTPADRDDGGCKYADNCFLICR